MTTSGNVRRIQRKRTKGWRMPPNTIYVGRPTKWGNPYVRSRVADAVMLYEETLRIGLLPVTTEDVKRELRGENLACWCRLGQPCHADVLLKIANEGEPNEQNG